MWSLSFYLVWFFGLEMCQYSQLCMTKRKVKKNVKAWHRRTRKWANRVGKSFDKTRFFITNAFFSTHPEDCLIFSWFELQILLRCCLIHKGIIIPRHIIYIFIIFVSMSYLCDLFFIFIFIFIIINIVSLKQTHLLFAHFLEYTLLVLVDYVDEESK